MAPRKPKTFKGKLSKEFKGYQKAFNKEMKGLGKSFQAGKKSLGDKLEGKDSSLKGTGIRSKISTKVKDKGYKAIIEQLKILEKEPYVKVGFPKESDKSGEEYDGQEKTTTVLDVAVWHEFGTDKLPERSFIRAAHDEMLPEMKALIARCMKAIYEGKITVSRALGIVGLTAERNTKKFLTDNKVKPPSQKGDSSLFSFTPVKNGQSKAPKKDIKRNSMKTLIDTAQMLNSITHYKVMSGKRT